MDVGLLNARLAFGVLLVAHGRRHRSQPSFSQQALSAPL
jgi:hypothetical protein